MAKKNSTNAEERMVTSIRLTRGEHAALKALAAREKRSMAGQLKHVIEAIAAQERKAA